MKKFIADFFKNIYLSCVSFPFYQSIVADPFKRTLRYFLIFIVLLSIISSIPVWIYTFKESKKVAEWIVEHNLEFKDGSIVSDIREKIETKDKNLLFVFDPTGATKDLPMQQAIEVLVTDKKIKIKNGARVQEIAFTQIKDFSLNKDSVYSLRKMLLILSSSILLIMSFIFTTISKLFQILLLSFFTLLNNRLWQNEFSFEQIINICSYAIIPPSVLNLFFSAFNIKIPYFDWLYLVMYVLFSMGAIMACRVKNDQNMEISNSEE